MLCVSFCVGERGVTGLDHAGVLPAQLSSVLRQAAAQTEAGTRRWPQDLRPDQQQRQPRGLRLNLTRRRQRPATESRRKEGRRGRGLKVTSGVTSPRFLHPTTPALTTLALSHTQTHVQQAQIQPKRPRVSQRATKTHVYFLEMDWRNTVKRRKDASGFI